MNIGLIILSFVAGVLGTFMGATQTFIGTGFFGLVLVILTLMGIQGAPIDFLNNIVLNDFFAPCVIFNGAVVATAYAAKHHDIRGVDTNRSLLFTKDWKVFLSGGIGATLGYLIFCLLNYLEVPADTGALTIIVINSVTRLLFNKDQWINKKPMTPSLFATMNLLLFQCILALCVSIITIAAIRITNIMSITFYISAFSLIFSLKNPSFPVTHHISMITAYMFVQSGDVLLSIIFGIFAHMCFTLFVKYFNIDCGTHIDPPAVVIGTLSFIIFTVF